MSALDRLSDMVCDWPCEHYDECGTDGPNDVEHDGVVWHFCDEHLSEFWRQLDAADGFELYVHQTTLATYDAFARIDGYIDVHSTHDVATCVGCLSVALRAVDDCRTLGADEAAGRDVLHAARVVRKAGE